jgi:hypothetical protein
MISPIVNNARHDAWFPIRFVTASPGSKDIYGSQRAGVSIRAAHQQYKAAGTSGPARSCLTFALVPK